MIEAPELTEYRLKPIDHEKEVSSQQGETAYSFVSISHGKIPSSIAEKEVLDKIIPATSTLGFEIEVDCDYFPSALTTYNADKSVNSEYRDGGHLPGGKHHPEPCKFSAGEKVLCLIHEGYDAVFPGIIVGPLTRDYLEELHRTSDDPLVTAQSSEEFIDSWIDWNWDSVIVRPLVRLRNDWEEMGETVVINRVYLFPYKQFEI